MKLGEALAERADLQRRLEQLRSRIDDNARFQEGETPAEDAATLLAEAGQVIDNLERLTRLINRSNIATVLPDGSTLTDALAHRDALRQQHALLTAAADTASGRHRDLFGRKLRSELRSVSALPVVEIRNHASHVAAELRAVDITIQTVNWTADLQEDETRETSNAVE